MHFGRNAVSIASILNKLSLLPTDEFTISLSSFLTEQKLPVKASIVNAYQKMYRLLFQEEDFVRFQRGAFQPIQQRLNLPRENQFLNWRSDLSSKYDADEAIEIVENRLEGIAKRIHRTIDLLKNDEGFKNIIREKRKLGYLDWEIALAIMNFIVQYKATVRLKGINFNSEEEYVKAFGEEFQNVFKLDEEDFYIKFPVEAFRTPEFETQIKQLPHLVLKTYGLENKCEFPNFDTLREFLSVRFKLYENKDWKGNLLKDIV